MYHYAVVQFQIRIAMVRDIPNISLCDVYELILPDKNLLLHLFGEFSTFAT